MAVKKTVKRALAKKPKTGVFVLTAKESPTGKRVNALYRNGDELMIEVRPHQWVSAKYAKRFGMSG